MIPLKYKDKFEFQSFQSILSRTPNCVFSFDNMMLFVEEKSPKNIKETLENISDKIVATSM